jgi:hypothetical protein
MKLGEFLHYKCYDESASIDGSVDYSYVYEYRTAWSMTAPSGEDNSILEHFIKVTDYDHQNGELIQINFDPYSIMTRRDFERLVDYFKVKGDFPVHILPETPIRSGEPSYFCAINGIA